MKYLLYIIAFLTTFSSYAQDEKSAVVKALDHKFFEANRKSLREKMPDRSVAVFFSGIEKVKSNDVNYAFHQDPNFYYLTGLKEPDALLMVFKEYYVFEEDTIHEIIFVPGKSVEYEIWHGKRLGSVGVKEELKIEKVLVNSTFADLYIPFDYFDKILYHLPDGVVCDDPFMRGDMASLLKHFFFKTDTLQNRLDEKLLSSYTALMREDKSPEEMNLLKTAINITCESHKELMRKIDATYTEYKAEALIEFVFRDNGATGPGFPSIIGGGENSCVLHYIDNNQDLEDGDLLVVDIGAEYEMYSADVTRTIPVNGRFNQEQKIIYNLVLKAQNAGIDACLKGNKFWDPHEAATQVIQEGLRDLGIIKKSYEARKYFMHGTSHYLGLDVHDAGSYQPLKENNVITVEPGIYIPEGSDCDEKWWNIGIRIEDDILITSGKPINLSDCVPREVEEIESIMAQ